MATATSKSAGFQHGSTTQLRQTACEKRANCRAGNRMNETSSVLGQRRECVAPLTVPNHRFDNDARSTRGYHGVGNPACSVRGYCRDGAVPQLVAVYLAGGRAVYDGLSYQLGGLSYQLGDRVYSVY